MSRFSGDGGLFGQRQLPDLQLVDARLIGRDHRAVGRLDDAVEELIDLFLHIRLVALQRLGMALCLRETHVPGRIEHGAGEFDESPPGLQPMQDGLELALHVIAPDGLSIALAALGRAQIVGMPRAGLAARPAGGQGLVAVIAQHEAPQREVGVEVLAGRRLGALRQALLNALIGGEADQALVVSLAQRYAPGGRLHVAGIDRAGHQLEHPLIADLAVRQFLGIFGLGFEETLHLDLAVEAA